MDDLTPNPLALETPRGPSDLHRRTLVTTAAWAVPAVAMTAASPAFASSSNSVKNLSSPNDQLLAAGDVSVTATVVDANGAPIAGQPVTFSGPSGATFSPTTATSNPAGIATTTANLNDTWATPGSTATITAVAGGSSLSKGFTVLGSNVLAFGLGYPNYPTQTELVFPSPVAQITADDAANGIYAVTASVALLENGTVWTAGANAGGQLGDGTTTDRWTWAQVSGLSTVKQISVSAQSVVALQSDGTVMRWGTDPWGTLTSPWQQDGLTNVTQIAQSSTAIFALLSDGSVKVCGSNQNHVAGIGGTDWPGRTPRQVAGLTSGVVQITAGLYSGYALMTDGTARAWGWNGYGQLGDGTTTERETPTVVQSLTGTATQLAAQRCSLIVLRSDGSVVACGWNDPNGELGNGASSPSENPSLVPVTGLTSGVSAICATQSTGYALMTDGSLRAWGWNPYGQLGDGTFSSQLSPVTIGIPAGRTITQLGRSNQNSSTMFLVTRPT